MNNNMELPEGVRSPFCPLLSFNESSSPESMVHW